MTRTLEINNVTYEVLRPVNMETVRQTKHYNSIYHAYNRPSATKVSIWEQWLRRFREFDFSNVWVRSRNGFCFTIGAYVEHEGKRYFISITPKHNYIHEIQ